MATKRHGFTLIELLVVIAIIGILAAMLFPVFARARESARKTQCLANVKNIALAINMYLTDYDMLPPKENRAEVRAFVIAVKDEWSDCTGGKAIQMNPYLPWPVVLDEYVKNRDVWKCPSAKIEFSPQAIIGDPNWLAEVMYQQENGDWYGFAGRPCAGQFYPNGWGGAVTDSFTQDSFAPTDEGAFVQSVACLEYWRELKPGTIDDPASFVIVSDKGTGVGLAQFPSVEQIAYPDFCQIACEGACWSSDDSSCPSDCHGTTEAKTDHTRLKPAARHLGGVNLGFVDGHAKWWSSESILASAPRKASGMKFDERLVYRGLYGFGVMSPTTAGGDPAGGIAEGAYPDLSDCGQLPLY